MDNILDTDTDEFLDLNIWKKYEIFWCNDVKEYFTEGVQWVVLDDEKPITSVKLYDWLDHNDKHRKKEISLSNYLVISY